MWEQDGVKPVKSSIFSSPSTELLITTTEIQQASGNMLTPPPLNEVFSHPDEPLKSLPMSV